jgi:hypothetical protein
MAYELPYIYHAKLVIIMLLCIVYLPFSVTDLYLGINSQQLCIIKKHEISMKDYLILAGYSEFILLLFSIWMILTPSKLINDKIIQLYYVIYSGLYTLYTILNILGMYVFINHVYNTCNGLSEYIFISFISKFIFTFILVGTMCT